MNILLHKPLLAPSLGRYKKHSFRTSIHFIDIEEYFSQKNVTFLKIWLQSTFQNWFSFEMFLCKVCNIWTGESENRNKTLKKSNFPLNFVLRNYVILEHTLKRKLMSVKMILCWQERNQSRKIVIVSNDFKSFTTCTYCISINSQLGRVLFSSIHKFVAIIMI